MQQIEASIMRIRGINPRVDPHLQAVQELIQGVGPDTLNQHYFFNDLMPFLKWLEACLTYISCYSEREETDVIEHLKVLAGLLALSKCQSVRFPSKIPINELTILVDNFNSGKWPLWGEAHRTRSDRGWAATHGP